MRAPGLCGQSPCPCWDTNHFSSVAHFVAYSIPTTLPQLFESYRSMKIVNNSWVGWGEGVEEVEHLQHILDLSTCCSLAVCCMEQFYANKTLMKLERIWHVSSWCCMNNHWKTSRIRFKIKTIKLFRN